MNKVHIFFSAVCTLILLLLPTGAFATETQVKEWEFSFDKTNWEKVCIPHSWNAHDGHSQAYFRGKAFYRTKISCEDPSAPAFLRFEGAAQEAEVFVNGHSLAYHKGGYTPFTVNLAGVLTKGENLVEVVCDNSESMERIPVSSDFNKNGGLHNPVVLITLPQIYFDPAAFGFDRFHLVQKDVNAKRAVCELRTRVHNVTSQDAKVKVCVTVKDASGKPIRTVKGRINVPAGFDTDFIRTVKVRRPHLWNGKKDPYLYTIEVAAGEDIATGRTGLRHFRIDREKGFFLNGESYPLRGVAMHQDTDGKASALDKVDFDSDYRFVQEIGCNFLRLAHYPHNNYAFDLCDSLGIVVQTEVPWVNVCGVRATDAYFENIRQQMKEMITALYNHPSIIFWGMWNELDTWGNKEEYQGTIDMDKVIGWTAELYAFAKGLDPTRPVGFTDDSKFKKPRFQELRADYYSENCYFGWYYSRNDFSGLTPLAHWIKDTMGPLNISEYGVGVNPYCHIWNSDDIRRYHDDKKHPEEYGNRFHESHLQQIACMPFLNFTSIWVFFDFPVADRHEGYLDSSDGVNFIENSERLYMNDKGLVTRDRKTKKDAFYLYKAWWNHEQTTVYIAEKRLECRPRKGFSLTVYSNASSLTLYRDGKKVITKTASDEISGVIWKFDTWMGDKPATFKVVADDGTQDSVTFKPLVN